MLAMAIYYLILLLTIVMAIGYFYPLFDFVTNYCYGY
jgi:hypothetical protein